MNKLNKTILRISTAMAVASSLPIIAQAQDAARLINQANAAVRSGDIDAALADYEQAAAVQPNLPELQYNEAVARYRKGEIEQARQLFHEVVTDGDAELAGQARYNLANCDYADAVKLSEQDKPAAIEKLRSAISHYRGALESNSNDADARANIELANMLIKQLQDQQKQEQQQQDQQDKDEQQQNKNQKQQDQESKDQQQQDQQNKDQQRKDENSEQNESDKQDQQQSQDSQKQDKKSDSSQEQNQESQQDQPQDQQDQSQSADQQKQQDAQTGNPEEQKDEQSQEQQEDQGKRGQLQAANPSEEQDDQQATSSAMVNAGDEERPMTKEEAQKMLQAVRDRDLLRRMQRLQDQRSRHIPVDRDW